jgi:hypothetical protein
MVVTEEVEEMTEMQDEITMDSADSQTEWECILSTVLMPRTICQHIWYISQCWTRDKNITQGVGTAQNWVVVLEDEELNPVEILRQGRYQGCSADCFSCHGWGWLVVGSSFNWHHKPQGLHNIHPWHHIALGLPVTYKTWVMELGHSQQWQNSIH